MQPASFGVRVPGAVAFRWVGPVPDGVSRVRWTFDCRYSRGSCASHVATVPVEANVAVAAEPSSWCHAGACPTVDATVWFGAALTP